MHLLNAKPRSEPEIIKKRLENLEQAFAMAAEEMHRCDGTQPDSPMGNRDMAIAKTNLDTAWLWARKAVEES